MSRHDPFPGGNGCNFKTTRLFFVGHNTLINAPKSWHKEKKTSVQSQMKKMCGKTLIMPFNAMQFNHTFTEEFIKRFDRTVISQTFSTPLTFGDLARALNENRQWRHRPAILLYRTNRFPIHPIRNLVQSVLLRAQGKVTMKKRASASLFSLSLSSALCISAFLFHCR